MKQKTELESTVEKLNKEFCIEKEKRLLPALSEMNIARQQRNIDRAQAELNYTHSASIILSEYESCVAEAKRKRDIALTPLQTSLTVELDIIIETANRHARELEQKYKLIEKTLLDEFEIKIQALPENIKDCLSRQRRSAVRLKMKPIRR